MRRFSTTKAEFLRQKAIQQIEIHKSRGYDLTKEPIDEIVKVMLKGWKDNELKKQWIAEYNRLVASYRNRMVTYP